jgi:hypothetical protein
VACLGAAGLAGCSTGDPASPDFDPVAPRDAAAALTDADAMELVDVVPQEFCPDAGYPACPATPPSWSNQVQNLVDTYCSPCHFNGGIGTGNGFDYSTSAGLRHGLTTALTDVHGCVMPPSGSPPLPMADWDTLLEWLSCGAPNN